MKAIILTIFYFLFTFPAIAASLSGTVTDYKTSLPIPNVHVACSNNDSTHTDNQGFYEFENLGFGVYDFTFTKTDFQSQTLKDTYVGAGERLDIKLYPPCLLRIETSSLPLAKKGCAYNTNIELSCTTEPFYFTIVSGELPQGLSLDTTSGNISGIPTMTQTSTFTIGVTDVLNHYTHKMFSLPVKDPLTFVDNEQLPNAIKWREYFHNFSVSGGTSPFVFEIISGALPSGLTLTENATIIGTPQKNEMAYFSLKVTDATSLSEQKNFRLEVIEPLVIDRIKPAHALVGETYHLQLSATGGIKPYEWKIYSGQPPKGLTLEPVSGIFLGTPQEATYGTIVFEVTDSDGQIDFLDVILQVVEPLEIVSNKALPNAFVNEHYSELIRIKGGIPPYIFNYKGTLQMNLNLNANKGIISGVPLNAELTNIEITVSDSTYPASQSHSKRFTLETTEKLTILTSSVLPNAQKGVQINDILFHAAGGHPPYTWSDFNGNLPQGISLNSATGILSGTPSDKGDILIVIEVRDESDKDENEPCIKEFLWHIADDLSIITGGIPDAAKNVPFNFTLQADGGQKPYHWRIKSGAPVSGLSFNNETGTIDGIPDQAGQIRSFTVELSDSDTPAQKCDKTFTMQVIQNDLYILTPELPNGRIDEVYHETITASLGIPPYHWQLINGLLPDGLEFITSPSIAYITGTPLVQDTYEFTIKVSDSNISPKTVTQTFALEIYGGLTFLTQSLKKACQNQPYFYRINVTNGTLPYYWQIIGDNFTSGLQLNALNGTISGTPNLMPGQYEFVTIRVTDSSIPQGKIETEWVIYGMNCSLDISPSDIPKAMQKRFFQVNLDANGGISPYHWFISSGTLPEGLHLNAETGIIYGNPIVCGTYEFIVGMEDSASGGASKDYQIEILCNGQYVLSGTINDFTGHLSNILLTLDGNETKTTYTDENGQFSFDNIPNGTYFLVPEKDRYDFTPSSKEITIHNQDRMGVDFHAQFHTNAPTQPSNPYPQHNAINVPLNPELSWTASDPDADTLYFNLYIGKHNPPGLIAENLDQSSFHPSILDKGITYYWQVNAIDEHGAETIGPTWQFTAMEMNDLTPPSAPGNLYASPEKAIWTRDNIIQIHWNQSIDPQGSGIAGYSYIWDTIAFTRPDAIVETTELQTFSNQLSDDRNHYFHICAIDNAGNASQAVHYGPFQIDTHPPEDGTIVINNNDDETSATSVTLSLTAVDLGSGLKSMQFSNDGINWTSPEDYSAIAHHFLDSGKGERTVYARFSDKAGNWTDTSATDTIVLGMSITPQPQDLQALAGNSETMLSWIEIDNATYTLYRSETENGLYYPVNITEINHSHVVNNRVTFTDRDLDNHKTYYYKVKACIDDMESKFSTFVSVTPEKTFTFTMNILNPIELINIGSTALYYIQINPENNFQGSIHLTSSGLDPSFSKKFIVNEQDMGASISNLIPPATIIFEVTAGSGSPLGENQFTIAAQNIWASGSSDLFEQSLSVITSGRFTPGIYVALEKSVIRKGEAVSIYGRILDQLVNNKDVTITINSYSKDVITSDAGEFRDDTCISTLPMGEYVLTASFTDMQSDRYHSQQKAFTIGKGSSAITCLRQSDSLPENNTPFRIQGILSPQISNQKIMISVTDPESTITHHEVFTDESGQYTLTKNFFTKLGEWKFKAYWMGNDRYSGCESDFLRLPFGNDIGRAIILAGGEATINNRYWDVTKTLTTDAYRNFKVNGFSDELIYFMINTDSIDINSDGKNDLIVDNILPTTSNFTRVFTSEFTTILDQNTPLFIYMQGHATEDKQFTILGTDDQTITPRQVNTCLNTLQENTGCTTILILESCYSGLFIPDIEASNRVILTSAGAETYKTDASGQVAFSKFLFAKLTEGDSLKRAFELASDQLVNLGYPSPQISDPSQLADQLYLGGMLTWANRPEIDTVELPKKIVEGLPSTSIAVKGNGLLKKVWVQTIPPNYKLIGSSDMIEYPEFVLQYNNETGCYEGKLDHLTVSGVYKILTFAQDYDNNVSYPRIDYLSVVAPLRKQGDVNGDGVIDLKDVILMLMAVGY